MINHVVFDFVDTLAELRPSRELLVANYYSDQYKISIDPRIIARHYRLLDHCMFYSSLEIQSEEERREYYYSYNKKLINGLGMAHFHEDIHEHLFELFSYSKRKWWLKDGVEDLIQELNDNKKDVSILSNFGDNLSQILEEANIASKLKWIVTSVHAKLEKPNVEFYNYFLKKSNFNLADTLYVGDNYTLDYLPAKAVGLKVILLDEENIYNDNRITINRITDLFAQL
jgi:HAD superfamily hydrolase (TIGR01549 family)